MTSLLLSTSLSFLYQIAHLGDDDEEPEFSSAMPLEEGDTFFFAPRPLRNLVLVDELESLSPILSSQVADLGECMYGLRPGPHIQYFTAYFRNNALTTR